MKTIPLLAAAVFGLSLLPAWSQKSNEPRPEAPPEAAAETPPEPLKLSKAEAAAVAAYKEDMLAVQKWIVSYQETSGASEAKIHRLPGKLSERLGKVRTKGLPDVLTKALAAVRKNLNDQMALLKDLPEDDPAAGQWMEKQNAIPAFNKKRTDVMDQQGKAETALIDAGVRCGAGVESDLYQTSGLAQMKDRWVVILGAYKDYAEAKTDAVKIARASKVPFSMRGMIYDKKGLHLPEDSEDEAWAGEYILRRDNTWSTDDGKDLENHISVEISGEYDGFKPGYFIPVGYIAETAADAEKKAAEFKKHAPGTYVKKTRIYMGCMH